jgi:beta-lactamase regulating signal transducer with metallopeptidase domain
MNVIQLLEMPLLQSLAFTVVLAMKAMSRSRAAHRYRVAVTALLVGPLLLATSTAAELRRRAFGSAPAAAAAQNGPAAPISGPLAAPIDATSARPMPPWQQEGMAIAAVFWLILVALRSMRLASNWREAGRLMRTDSSKHTMPGVEELEAAFHRARARMRVSAPVLLRYVAEGASPFVVGAFRAVILLPISVASRLSMEQVELLLAHELAHIRRLDYVVNLIQSWIEALFFFHPGMIWLSRRIRIERELAVDDAVVDAYERGDAYAVALGRLAELAAATRAPLAIGASSSPLMLRLRRLLGDEASQDRLTPRWMSALAVPGLLVATLGGTQLLSAQRAAREMVDGQPASGLQVVARQQHRNRHWSRSALVEVRATDGTSAVELRLGGRFRAIRFRAIRGARPSDELASLSVETLRWNGVRRSMTLLPRHSNEISKGEADSLVATFFRESGFQADRRAGQIFESLGARGLILEVSAIGNPTSQATYLRAGIERSRDPGTRLELVEQALTITSSPVEVAVAVAAAMRKAGPGEELVGLVSLVPRIRAEAQMVELLLAALRIAPEPRDARLREAIEQSMAAIPSEEARSVVAARTRR